MVFHPFKSRKLIVDGHSFAILLRIGSIRWSIYRLACFIPRVWEQGRIITQAHKLKIRNNDLRSAEPACMIEKDKERLAHRKGFFGILRFPYPSRPGMLAKHCLRYATFKDCKRHTNKIAFILRHGRR